MKKFILVLAALCISAFSVNVFADEETTEIMDEPISEVTDVEALQPETQRSPEEAKALNLKKRQAHKERKETAAKAREERKLEARQNLEQRKEQAKETRRERKENAQEVRRQRKEDAEERLLLKKQKAKNNRSENKGGNGGKGKK